MRSLSRMLVVVAASLGGYFTYGCGVGVGTGGVYVGVAVPGPYVGYPGYPGYIGRPPVVYYEEDALLLPVGFGERYAKTGLEGESEEVCPSEPDQATSCASVPRDASPSDGDTGADPAGGER